MDAEADYPAAHSMDTIWFAVDREGLVAYFDSGEEGAVPVSALRTDDPDGYLEEWRAIVPETEAIYDLVGRRYHFDEGGRHFALTGADRPETPSAPIGPVLMFVASLDAVRGEIERGEAVVRPSVDQPAILLPAASASVLGRLHEGGHCLWCDTRHPWDDDRVERLGLYHYDNDRYGNEPYGRVGCPRVPIHVDQLPDRLRDALMRACFTTVSFEDAPRVQPVELVPCMTHGSYYLSLDGTIRAVPGREDDYREYYPLLAETFTERRVEPPPEV